MPERTLWSHEIRLDAEPVSVSRARGFVRRHLHEHGLARLSGDVELVASELTTNAIVHARTSFTVLLHAFEDVLLLEVEDDSHAHPPRTGAPHIHDTHARGLTIVGVMSRDWGVDALPAGGKSVWAEFGLPEQCSLG